MLEFLWKRKEAPANAAPAEPPVETARDKAAKEYFLSEEFLAAARVSSTRQLVELGYDHATVFARISPKEQDSPFIETTLAPLKSEFPEIKRVVVGGGSIMLDTLDEKQRKKVNARGIGGP